MNIIKKILKCPVWAFAVISLAVAYCASEWYAHVMFQRWAESDGTDAEAYAAFNHSGANTDYFLPRCNNCRPRILDSEKKLK